MRHDQGNKSNGRKATALVAALALAMGLLPLNAFATVQEGASADGQGAFATERVNDAPLTGGSEGDSDNPGENGARSADALDATRTSSSGYDAQTVQLVAADTTGGDAFPMVINEVTLHVSQPAVGNSTDTEAPYVEADDWTYKVTSTSWVDSEGNVLTSPTTFESGSTYYIAATVLSYWESDATYYFQQNGSLQVTVNGGTLIGISDVLNVYGAASTMRVRIAVQPVARRDVDQIQVWTGDINGNTAMGEAGGKVGTIYTPSNPNVNGFGKDGTLAGMDVVQYYTGDEITVKAQVDAGHRFVGWFHANDAYDMSGGNVDHNGISPNKAYEGSAISTASSFTYKPGVTVIDGDAEPLRYICAVFEADTAAAPAPTPAPTDSAANAASATSGAAHAQSVPATGDHLAPMGMLLLAIGLACYVMLVARTRMTARKPVGKHARR